MTWASLFTPRPRPGADRPRLQESCHQKAGVIPLAKLMPPPPTWTSQNRSSTPRSCCQCPAPAGTLLQLERKDPLMGRAGWRSISASCYHAEKPAQKPPTDIAQDHVGPRDKNSDLTGLLTVPSCQLGTSGPDVTIPHIWGRLPGPGGPQTTTPGAAPRQRKTYTWARCSPSPRTNSPGRAPCPFDRPQTPPQTPPFSDSGGQPTRCSGALYLGSIKRR